MDQQNKLEAMREAKKRVDSLINYIDHSDEFKLIDPKYKAEPIDQAYEGLDALKDWLYAEIDKNKELLDD